MAEAQLRGPRIGDAASLWNFTPAPGWTKEEAQMLKLCLMAHGVGRWMQILETGLLPGKLIQQLNGQTQRLLGQQSLAAYTGLQVDIDRIRADNDKLLDAERKNGLVINSGPNLTKQQKLQMQEEAKTKYGLSPSEVEQVEGQLQELLKSRGPAAAAGGGAGGGGTALQAAGAAAAGGVQGRAQREAELLACDTSCMSKEQKLNFLLHLHEKLQQASARLAKAAAAPGRLQHGQQQQQQQQQQMYQHATSLAAAAGSAENEGAVANTPMQLDAQPEAGYQQQQQQQQSQRQRVVVIKAPAAWAAGKAASSKRKAAGGGRRAQQAETSSDEDAEDWQPAPRPHSGRGRRAAATAEAMRVDAAWGYAASAPAAGGDSGHAAASAAALEADVQELSAMGFTASQARDALEESGGDMEAAVEWLVANCV